MAKKTNQPEMVAIERLSAHPRNYKRHPPEQLAHIQQSLRDFGVYRNIVVAQGDVILAGHGVVEAARAMGMTELPVYRLDLEPLSPSALKVLALDNELGKFAESDPRGLSSLLQEIAASQDGLVGTGYDDKALGKLLATLAPEVPAVVDDATPQVDRAEELRERWGVRLGQLWALSDHRLLCGDSTKVESVARVMGDERADICFTSPPYNAAAVPLQDGKHPNKYQEDNDARSDADYTSLLVDFTRAALTSCEFVFVNVQSLAGNKRSLIDYLHTMVDAYADSMIWDKMTAEPAMAHNVLNSRFEYVHVFSSKANRVIGAVPFRGTKENIFAINSRQGKEFAAVHKATFPIQLPAHFVSSFCRAGQALLEPFSGTGTTLLACEQLGRKCRAIELSPGYVALTLQRFEDATGKAPSLLEDGRAS